jgi:hypothetical protein
LTDATIVPLGLTTARVSDPILEHRSLLVITEPLVRTARFIVVLFYSAIWCGSVEAGNFSWVASANTSTVSVDELAGGVANGITETCTQAYPMAKYGFYVVGTDYLSPKDGMYVYSVTVTVTKKGSQGSDVPPVDSFSFSGYRPGTPPVAQRRQLLVQAAQVAAFEVCRRVAVRR